MKKIIFIILMLASANAFAKPTTGFHEGPYLLANVGILNYTVDNNIRTNTQVARDWEPSYGINFGWNIKDYIAPELEIRYATNKNNGNREQAVDVNLNVVYTFIATPLVMNDAMAFLPFVQAGPMVQFAGIPGIRSAQTTRWLSGARELEQEQE